MDAMNPLLEITQGCTHNNCKFCNMYKDIPFKMSPLEWIQMNGYIPRDQKEFIQRLEKAINEYDKIGAAMEYHRSHTYTL